MILLHNGIQKRLHQAALVLVALAIAPVAQLARAQVLSQVPSDALLVVKINHVQDTSTKLAGLLQQLGVVDFVPDMADPLGALEKQAGLTEGLDAAGDAAFVLLNKPEGADAAPAGPPPMLILIPVKDYQAFIGQATLVRTEGDVSVVHFKKSETEDTYVAKRGNYAAISPGKDAITAKANGLTATGLSARQMDSQDAVMFVNMPALRPMILPMLQDNREKLIAEFEKGMAAGRGGDAAAANSPLAKAIINQVLNCAQEFVQDNQATTVGMNITKAGVNTTMLAEFTPNSYIGNITQQLKGTDQPMLGGLPASKYLFFGGATQNPQVVLQLVDDFIAPIKKDIVNMGDKGKIILDAIETGRAALGSVESASFGLPATDGPGGFIKMIAVYHGDAQKLKDAQAKNAAAQEAWMQAFATPGQTVKATYTPNAKTVDGVQFDQNQLQFTFDPDKPQAHMAQQMMTFMYGPDGITLNYGVIDPKTLLLVSGGDDALMTQAVTAAKSGKDVLSADESIQVVNAELPKNRLGVFYVPLDTIISTAVTSAGKMGLPVPPVQLPPNLPPIGTTIGTEGTALRIDSHIPAQLVQSLIQAGRQLYLQMNGGRANPGGGL